jgi:hypothetical protein
MAPPASHSARSGDGPTAAEGAALLALIVVCIGALGSGTSQSDSNRTLNKGVGAGC